VSTRTPDGYDMCPSCGHHTSAFAGSCTVMVPLFNQAGDLVSIDYCGCDCYKALHGRSLLDGLFGES